MQDVPVKQPNPSISTALIIFLIAGIAFFLRNEYTLALGVCCLTLWLLVLSFIGILIRDPAYRRALLSDPQS